MTEAGGIISDAHGKPLNFSLGRRLVQNEGVVAAGKEVHSSIIEALKAVWNPSLSAKG